MSDKTTGAMQQFGDGAELDDPGAGPNAGVVLLYADRWESLPAGWPLSHEPTLIGRESADIVLDVSAVSRRHAEIVYERGGYAIRDLDSRNGTLVDGRPIREAPIEEGSEIRIGDAVLKFVPQAAELYASYRIDGSMFGNAARRCTVPTSLVGGYQ